MQGVTCNWGCGVRAVTVNDLLLCIKKPSVKASETQNTLAAATSPHPEQMSSNDSDPVYRIKRKASTPEQRPPKEMRSQPQVRMRTRMVAFFLSTTFCSNSSAAASPRARGQCALLVAQLHCAN